MEKYEPDEDSNGNHIGTTYKGEYKYVDEYFPDDFERIYPPGAIKTK